MEATSVATRDDRVGSDLTERTADEHAATTVAEDDGGGLRGTMRGETVTVERAAVGVVDAGRAELHAAAAGLVYASEDVTIDRGGARQIYAGGSVRISQGGAGMILARGDARIERGGTGSLVSLGTAGIEQGGAGLVTAGRATIGRGGVVALAISPRIDVADGGRILAGPTAAIGTIAGIALGFLIGRLVGRARS